MGQLQYIEGTSVPSRRDGEGPRDQVGHRQLLAGDEACGVGRPRGSRDAGPVARGSHVATAIAGVLVKEEEGRGIG